MHNKIRNFKLGNTISGVLLMILHAISISAYYILAKNLTNTLYANQLTFLYKFSLLIAVIPWCMKGGFVKNLRTKRIGIHITRGTFSVMGALCFFKALSHIGVVDTSAIAYLENAIVLGIGIIYFKERFTIAKLILIICGFSGALFIIRPGFQEFNKYYVYMFFALLFWAVNNFSIKILGKTERSKPQLFYAMLIGSVLSFPLALQNWQPLELVHFKYIILLSAFHMIHTIALFKAFKIAEISAVMPFDYLRLIFTGVLSVIFLHEIPDGYSIVGYCLISFGGIYLIQSEARKKGFTHESERKALAIEAIRKKRRERTKLKKKMEKVAKD